MNLLEHTETIYNIRCMLCELNAPQEIIQTYDRLITNLARKSSIAAIQQKCKSDIQILQNYSILKSGQEPYDSLIVFCAIANQSQTVT